MASTTLPAAAAAARATGESQTRLEGKPEAALPKIVELESDRFQHLQYADPDFQKEARAVLARTHTAAIRYSEAAHWGDSSNKLSWLIPDLAALLPEAKFVHLVRDGRKVAGSYFRKLLAECYDNRSIEILQAHYDNPLRSPAPPVPVRRGSGATRQRGADGATTERLLAGPPGNPACPLSFAFLRRQHRSCRPVFASRCTRPEPLASSPLA